MSISARMVSYIPCLLQHEVGEEPIKKSVLKQLILSCESNKMLPGQVLRKAPLIL